MKEPWKSPLQSGSVQENEQRNRSIFGIDLHEISNTKQLILGEIVGITRNSHVNNRSIWSWIEG